MTDFVYVLYFLLPSTNTIIFSYILNVKSTFQILNQPIQDKIYSKISTYGGLLMVDFGNKLKTLRLQNNLTQIQLAKKLGVTKSVISAYENSLRMPSYDILIAIAKTFKVTTDYLLGLEHKQDIDLSGLTNEEISALLNLIKAMKR